jgi:hypothetical protein
VSKSHILNPIFAAKIFSKSKQCRTASLSKLFKQGRPKMILEQGCQMVCFQTKNPNLGKFLRAIEWKLLVYFMVIWLIIWPFGNVVVIWYIFPRFGILCQEKSGNPVLENDLVSLLLLAL